MIFRAAFHHAKSPLVLSSLLILSASYAQAGFEWIPPQNDEPEIIMHDAVKTPVAPLEKQKEMQSPKPAMTPLDPVMAPISSSPAKQPVVKRKTFSPPPQTAAAQPEALKAMDKNTGSDVVERTALPPLKEPEATPADLQHVKRKIMIPDDAPMSVKDAMHDSATTTVAPQQKPSAAIVPAQKKDMSKVVAKPVASKYQVVSGFGKDMPLALAMSQIVPASYAYSFGTNVNPGARVSWNGNKPWNEVVKEMIAPLNLHLNVKGQRAHIHKEGSTSEMPALQAPKKMGMSSKSRATVRDPGQFETSQPAHTIKKVKSQNEEQIAQTEKAEEITVVRVERLPSVEPSADSLREPIHNPADIVIQSDSTNKPVDLTLIAPKAGEGMDPESSDVKTQPEIETARVDDAFISPVIERQIWEAQKGDSLKKTLNAWSTQANFEIVWDAAHDYTLESDLFVTGTYQRAIKTMVKTAVDLKNGPLLTFISSETQDQPSKVIIEDEPQA